MLCPEVKGSPVQAVVGLQASILEAAKGPRSCRTLLLDTLVDILSGEALRQDHEEGGHEGVCGAGEVSPPVALLGHVPAHQLENTDDIFPLGAGDLDPPGHLHPPVSHTHHALEGVLEERQHVQQIPGSVIRRPLVDEAAGLELEVVGEQLVDPCLVALPDRQEGEGQALEGHKVAAVALSGTGEVGHFLNKQQIGCVNSWVDILAYCFQSFKLVGRILSLGFHVCKL